MLKRLYVDNYRSLVNFELHFLPLTFLAGSNGSGKTSILNIIFALRELLSGSAKVMDSEIFPSSSLTRWQNQCLQVFELDVEIKQESFCYRLEIEHDPSNKRARILFESLTFVIILMASAFVAFRHDLSKPTPIRKIPSSIGKALTLPLGIAMSCRRIPHPLWSFTTCCVS